MASTTTISNGLQRNLLKLRRCLSSMRSYSLTGAASPMKLELETSSKMENVNNSFIGGGDSSNKNILSVSEENLELRANHGAGILSSGGLIATPTDTVYGIAGDAQNDCAISKIYEIKGRIASKPIAICVSKIEQVYHWGKVKVPRSLLEDLLPGPVTLVFERQSILNSNLNPNTNLIGIRIPDHKFILKLAELHGGPVALTSANFSSQPSTLAVEEFQDMWPSLQCVFNGGRLTSCEKSEAAARAGSTVIDLSTEGHFSIIRNGTAYEKCVNLLKSKYNMQLKY